MKKFKIWWKDGTTEIVEGPDGDEFFAHTFNRIYGAKSIEYMDRWMEMCSCPPECIISSDHINTKKVRQFVKVSDGRIGVIMANETCGGVFRGHCDVWFGDIGYNDKDEIPVVEQLCVNDDWEEVECPLGKTKYEKGT